MKSFDGNPFEKVSMDNAKVDQSQSAVTGDVWNPGNALREDPKELDKPEDNKVGDALTGIDPVKIDYLASMVQKEFSTYKGGRYIQEQTFIRAHLNVKGVYSADMDFNGGTSRAFVQITRPKVQTMVGMVMPILLPNGNNAWTIDPAPRQCDPDLIRIMITQGASTEEIKAAMYKKAQDAADNLSSKVESGLIEDDFCQVLTRAVLDCGIYGTGVIYGPLAEPTGVDVADDDGGIQEDQYRPHLEHISVLDFYPDPGARTIQECQSVIVRKVLNKRQLRDLMRDADGKGFFRDAIEDVIREYGEGNWTPEYWESIINIANSQQQMTAPNGRYVCLVRWGWVSGDDLIKAGIKGINDVDRDEQVMCQIWVVGHKIIALRVSDLYRDQLPFYVFPFSLVPHTIWGSGIPEQMFDTQDAVNATERAKMDNMALTARPQIFVNVDRLVKSAQPLEQRPGKIWAVKESEIAPMARPIEWYTPDCRLGEIQQIQNVSMQLADEQTSMPKLLQGFGGEGVHNRTSSGASMQFNAAITPLKTVIFNIENHLITRLINNFVKFYHTFSKDPGIRGNFKVFARGVQGLMARESLINSLNSTIQFLGSIPGEADRIDYDQVGDLFVRCNDLVDNSIILPDAVVAQRRQKAAQDAALMQQQQQQVAAKIKSETSPKDALLQAVQHAPNGSNLKLALLDELLSVYGLKTPDVSKAIEYEKTLNHIGSMERAHKSGVSMGDTYGLSDSGEQVENTQPAEGPEAYLDSTEVQ